MTLEADTRRPAPRSPGSRRDRGLKIAPMTARGDLLITNWSENRSLDVFAEDAPGFSDHEPVRTDPVKVTGPPEPPAPPWLDEPDTDPPDDIPDELLDAREA